MSSALQSFPMERTKQMVTCFLTRVSNDFCTPAVALYVYRVFICPISFLFHESIQLAKIIEKILERLWLAIPVSIRAAVFFF